MSKMTQEELDRAYELGYDDGMMMTTMPNDGEQDLKWNEYYLEGFADGQADYDLKMQALYAHMFDTSVSDGTHRGPKGINADTYESNILSEDEGNSVQRKRTNPRKIEHHGE